MRKHIVKAVGRLTPVRNDQAQMARTGDEYIFSFEGDYDFATKERGPQDGNRYQSRGVRS